MEIKICVDDAVVKTDHDTLIIQRDQGFLSLNNCILGSGFSKVKSIINHSISKKKELTKLESERYINDLLEKKGAFNPAALMFTNADLTKIAAVTQDKVTAIVIADILDIPNSSKARVNVNERLNKINNQVRGSINTIVVVNENLTPKTLLNAFETVTAVKSEVFWNLDIRNPQSGDSLTNTFNDSTIIACIPEKLEYNGNNAEIQESVGKCVREATSDAIKNNGYKITILDFIESLGVKIEDLVDAGMELCVGVEINEYLNEKLKNEILKALKDINVISFIIAGARLEEDYAKERIHGINVSDDPAFLYADEVMGMAIANQIAGTKAIFNFKRYDEAKPGIIGELGPILDDIFAGIVAGCMSKIFEEQSC
ncbi:MAG: hypothetical protein FJ150_01240 [Euryarchaeota archaeon]|nr:hypothetical protein [Euryarchaeota archaeon]